MCIRDRRSIDYRMARLGPTFFLNMELRSLDYRMARLGPTFFLNVELRSMELDVYKRQPLSVHVCACLLIPDSYIIFHQNVCACETAYS